MRVVCTLLVAAALAAPMNAAAQDGAPQSITVDTTMRDAGPRRSAAAWEAAPAVQPPSALVPKAGAVARAGEIHSVTMRRRGKGEYLMFAAGLVVVGAGTYKLGEATDVGILESTGAFMATVGLLGLVLPIFAFY